LASLGPLTIALEKKIAVGSGGFEGARRPKYLRPNGKMFFLRTIADPETLAINPTGDPTRI